MRAKAIDFVTTKVRKEMNRSNEENSNNASGLI